VLFDEVVARELLDEERIVARNDRWIAYVPYAARYPFEIHVTPLNPVADLTGLTELDRDAFPEIALEVTRRLDGVFGIEMAYIAAWHQAPVRVGRDLLRLHWQITSVRRAPGKLKYLAGSESAMGAFIMDMRPEQSAAQLREVVLYCAYWLQVGLDTSDLPQLKFYSAKVTKSQSLMTAAWVMPIPCQRVCVSLRVHF
jgi:UDPglucose--hexose-1-phosphate uridylyltransferase